MKRVLIFILSLLIVALIGFYAYDVALKHTPIEENLPKLLIGLIVIIISIIRVQLRIGPSKPRHKPLDFYEKRYEAELGLAFHDRKAPKKKLLKALRFYNEDNYGKALNYLQSLLKTCKTKEEFSVVLLFTALCFSELQLNEHAIRVYQRLLERDPYHVKAHSNLGLEYMEIGDYDMAKVHFEKSISLDATYAQAYHNLATCLFRMDELRQAIPYAEKALELKKNLHQASSLLAIIYALLEEPEKEKKYFHLAISTGKSAEDIQAAIAHYKAEREALQNEDL